MPAQVPATPVAYSANAALYTGIGNLRGWSLRATAATTVVRLRDGTTVSGPIIAEVGLPTSGTTDNVLDPAGVHFNNGLYAELVSGTAEGAVYIA
jgi:hypothetical protein